MSDKPTTTPDRLDQIKARLADYKTPSYSDADWLITRLEASEAEVERLRALELERSTALDEVQQAGQKYDASSSTAPARGQQEGE